MSKSLAALLVIIALASGAIGVGAHSREGSCPVANLPDCCKKAQTALDTTVASMARLCCKLNCSEPGSTSSNTSSSFPAQPDVDRSTTVTSSVWRDAFKPLPSSPQAAEAHHSNPRYIQHLALLI